MRSHAAVTSSFDVRWSALAAAALVTACSGTEPVSRPIPATTLPAAPRTATATDTATATATADAPVVPAWLGQMFPGRDTILQCRDTSCVIVRAGATAGSGAVTP
jgi:hypothetical protein